MLAGAASQSVQPVMILLSWADNEERMYSRRSVHSSSPELSGFGIAGAVAQKLGLIMLVWRSKTQPRALLPLIFILAVTYHSTDTDITASRLSVCLLAGLLILNHGLVRTQLSVTSNQPGPSQRSHNAPWSSSAYEFSNQKKKWHPFSVGSAWLCMENVWGLWGEEARRWRTLFVAGACCRTQPVSALIPVSWVTLSHI